MKTEVCMLKKISLIGILIFSFDAVYSAAEVPGIVVGDGDSSSYSHRNVVQTLSVDEPSFKSWQASEVLKVLQCQMGESEAFYRYMEDTHPLLVRTLLKLESKTLLNFISITIEEVDDLSSAIKPSESNALVRIESYLKGEKAVSTLASIFKNQTALKDLVLLDLSGNFLENNIHPIIRKVSYSPLSSLSLDYVFCEQEAENPPYPIESMQCLEEALSPEGGLENLVHLGLSGNHLGNEGAQMMGRVLQNNHRLLLLSFGDNDVTHEGARLLAQGLASNQSLRTLNLSYNSLQDGGAWGFFSHLGGNRALTKVYLMMSGITELCKEDLAYIYEGEASGFSRELIMMERPDGQQSVQHPDSLEVPLVDRRRRSSSVI